MKAKFTQFDAVVNILFIVSHIQTLAQWLMPTNSEECIETLLCIQMYFTLYILNIRFELFIKRVLFYQI